MAVHRSLHIRHAEGRGRGIVGIAHKDLVVVDTVERLYLREGVDGISAITLRS